MSSWNSFEDIDTWKLARVLTEDIYNLFKNTPLGKDFALRDQMNRSSGSIMDNIAEGFGREGNKEFIHFLTYSKGSCLELKSQLYRCFDRNYISKTDFELYKQKTTEIDNKIGGLIAYLKKSSYKGLKYKQQQTSNNKQRTTNNEQRTINIPPQNFNYISCEITRNDKNRND